jgi:hypothetical protein
VSDKPENKRKLRMTESRYREIWDCTNGHCHFCGDPLTFELRGAVHGSGRGAWEADHVFQLGRDGKDVIKNYLPACWECNRGGGRWFRSGSEVRELIRLGIAMRDEMAKGTELGEKLRDLSLADLDAKAKRRTDDKAKALAKKLTVTKEQDPE